MCATPSAGYEAQVLFYAIDGTSNSGEDMIVTLKSLNKVLKSPYCPEVPKTNEEECKP